MTNKFKKGDIVKFKDKNSDNAAYFRKGFFNLEIEECYYDEGEHMYDVYECDKSTSWTVYERELEHQHTTWKDRFMRGK